MGELQVAEWKRYGHDRLYVNLPDRQKVAWLDRKTGHLEVLDERYREQVLRLLAPYLPVLEPEPHESVASHRSAPIQAPGIPAAYDLSLNRPGKSIASLANHGAPSGFLRRILLLLTGRRKTNAWQVGIVGERIVGAKLDRLKSEGWRVLHSIPLSSKADIDHLLIGPGGIFVLNAKHYRNKRIWVGDSVVKVNGGKGRPVVAKSRVEAERVSRVLRRGCTLSTEVNAVLVFVGAAKVDKVATLLDVRVISREREISALKGLAGRLSPAEVEEVYAFARDARNWKKFKSIGTS